MMDYGVTMDLQKKPLIEPVESCPHWLKITLCMELWYEQEKHVRKFVYKSLLHSAWLWSRARLAINKNINISRYQTTNLLKTWFLFLVCRKGQREDKTEFLTKSIGIKICKPFAAQCFFTDYLNHKTANKTTCRITSSNPCQLWAH